jgi:putative membrane protein
MGLKAWTRPFTRFHRVPVFKRVWGYLLLVTIYTILVDYAEFHHPLISLKDAGPAGAYGSIVLGLLLVFRTNSAYERWWEGRKLWGQLVNESRNLCLKVRALNLDQDEKTRFGELIISFAYALKHHLRGTVPTEPLPGIGIVAPDEVHHLPMHIAQYIYDTITRWEREGQIKDFKLLIIDQHARAFSDICGSCERIKSSPIAISYRMFMRQGIALNLLAWPWFLTNQFNLLSALPPILLGAYFLIGIELIAEDIEEPFGHDDDDLPLDDICNTIKFSVTNMLEIDQNTTYTSTFKKPRLDMLRDVH